MASISPRSRDGLILKGSLPWRMASTVTLVSIAAICKTVLLAQSTSTRGQAGFVKLLKERERPIITISNHTSVVDDPLIWGLMPWSTLYNPHTVRWSMGSADICFTNRVLSTFFALGQTLPTYRHGIGIFQPAVDDAIQLLARRNAWIHVFPEGRVRQSEDLSMRYFKWGVARMILESSTLPDGLGVQPIVVPLFIEGLQNVMHDSRGFPTFLPRLFKRVKCTYGEPIPDSVISPYVTRWRKLIDTIELPPGDADEDTRQDAILDVTDGEEARAIRRELTKVLRDSVAELRIQAGYPPEHADAHLADFYNTAEGAKYDEFGNVPRPAIFDQYKEENLRKRAETQKRRAERQRQKGIVYEREGPT